ncbi:MAG: putative phosphothreonine lyase domain-containing protein, partial [Candidatus Bathyarchaeia archaeon]
MYLSPATLLANACFGANAPGQHSIYAVGFPCPFGILLPSVATSYMLKTFHAIWLNERLVVEEYTVMRKAEHQSPSKTTAAPWIYAEGKGEGCYEDGQTYVGKWLIFAPRESVDEVWKRVKRATEAGRLGIEAKVSTSRPSGYKSTDHVICVYTRDFRDKADVAKT